jgi:hypothetical protein
VLQQIFTERHCVQGCTGYFLRKSPEMEAIARKMHFHSLLCLAETSRLGHPFRKKYLESDLLVPFCLQERSGEGRIREPSWTSCSGIFLFLCKGVACVPCSHPSQTTTCSSLSRALRWHYSLGKTAPHLSSAWNDRRPYQREVPIACRKRLVTRAPHHPASANQTTGLQEDRSVPLVARCARMVRTWKQALFIVQPETLLR